MSPRRGTKKLYPIGELMEEFGVTNRALPFYEERGLLKPIRVSNARVYSSQDRDRLAAILEGKALGLTISEIAEEKAELDSAITKLEVQRARRQTMR
jgi:DNA-binding transcriptional MerR regulator